MESLTACVNSSRHLNASGYPVCSNPWNSRKTILQHRLIYLVTRNLLPSDIEGLVVRHKCDNRTCINPDHLDLGTVQDNVQDMLDRGRGNKARGVTSGIAKLNETAVKSIRIEYRTATLEYLASKYSVTKTTIACIVHNKTWKHVK